MDFYIQNLSNIDPMALGKQAEDLLFLKKNGFKIPETHICSDKAYEVFVQNNNVWKIIQKEIEQRYPKIAIYHVRASTHFDEFINPEHKKYLTATSSNSIIQAIEQIWQSMDEQTFNASAGSLIDRSIMIQKIVSPEYSGVLFTKNPITGFNEIVIELVSGLKDFSVEDERTPKRWVYKWGTWVERPSEQDDRRPIMQNLVRQAIQIAEKYGNPLELEWIYDGNEVHWLHLHPINPKLVNFYSNRIAKEYLPGIIKPLIWSVNVPIVNSAWKTIFEELVGSTAKTIDINNLAKSFYYRAYFNMGIIGDIFDIMGMPKESIELISGRELPGSEKPKLKITMQSLRYLPRILYFSLGKIIRFSTTIDHFLKDYQKQYDFYRSIDVETLQETDALHHIEELITINKKASYIVIITQLLQAFYTMMLQRILVKKGYTLEQVDYHPMQEKLREINPEYQIRLLHERYMKLTPEQQRNIQAHPHTAITYDAGISEFNHAFTSFLTRFGHLSDSGNDFSVAPWKELPTQVLKTIISHTTAAAPEYHEMNANLEKGFIFNVIYKRAMKYHEYRDRVTFLWTYGYGLFRSYYLHLGKLLTTKGVIKDQEDIFYLYYPEITSILNSNLQDTQINQKISRRKAEIEKYRDIILPEIIYENIPFKPLIEEKQAEKLVGIAASQGCYEGTVKVVRGSHDFSKVENGDILAIPYSDSSWTILFTKAKAIISESGGMLSHCAIVAREFNIPAVVSVKGTMQLKDNMQVVVDGYTGEVTIITST